MIMVQSRRSLLISALLGWSLFGGWPLAAFMTSALIPFGAESGHGLPTTYWPLSLGFLCATMILLSLGERTSLRLLHSKKAQGIALLALVLSCAAMFASGCFSELSIAGVFGLAGAAFSGASSGFLHVAWQRVLSGLSWNEIDVLVPLGYGGSLAVGFVASAVPAGVGTALLFFCLIASGAALLKTGESELFNRPPNDMKEESIEGRNTAAFPRSWLCTAIVVIVLWIPIVFVEDSVVADRTLSNWMFLVSVGAGVVVAVAFSYGAYVFSRRADMTLVAKAAVPLAILSLVSLCFLPAEWLVLAYVFSFAANTLMHVFLHIVSISLAKKGSCSIVRSTAGVLMPLYLASLLSTLLAPALDHAGTLEVAFFSVALLLLAVMFALPYSIGFQPSPQQKEVQRANDTEDKETPLKHEDPVQTIVVQYRLTKREAEVLELFAVGRDSGYIREKLFISRDTVNTHLKHIYSKLGIHSKRELLDLVESRKSGDTGRT